MRTAQRRVVVRADRFAFVELHVHAERALDEASNSLDVGVRKAPELDERFGHGRILPDGRNVRSAPDEHGLDLLNEALVEVDLLLEDLLELDRARVVQLVQELLARVVEQVLEVLVLGGRQFDLHGTRASSSPPSGLGVLFIGGAAASVFVDVVDTTPPVVSDLKASLEAAACKKPPCAKQFHITFDSEDAFSPIARAEYSLDAGPWQYIEPVGGLSDFRREHYDAIIPATVEAAKAEHLIAVRVYDRHDNVGVAKTVIPAQAK